MRNLCFLLTALLVFNLSLCQSSSDLDAVVVIFRHGDRTPVRPYPNDPYKDRSNWPADWGMLTNTGKRRHYELGQYFRQRYADFLPQIYSEKDIRVRSTDVDRTLMSAEAHLAGLYPPVSSDIWETDLAWQPIPIHSTPEKEDALLAAKKPCKKYAQLKKQLFKSPFFKNISHTNHDLYAYLTRYSGETISTLESMEYLYNTLKIEALYNFTLPDWALKVFPKKMQPSASLSFATATFTPALARLKTGLFFNELTNYFNNRTVTPSGAQFYAPKYLIYSAHDTTIANLLNSLGLFEYHCPPYTATIIFELHKTSNSSYVNIFYKNSTEAQPLVLPHCTFNCDFSTFKHLLSPLTLSLDQWETECNSIFSLDTPANLYILVSALLLALAAIVFLLILAKHRARMAQNNSYSQLPNEEYT